MEDGGGSLGFRLGDWVCPLLVLVLSVAVGLVASLKGRRETGRDETGRDGAEAEGARVRARRHLDFFQGGGALRPLPVALSLVASVCSGYSHLGIPAEVYRRGLAIWLFQMMAVPALLVTGLVFLPLFFELTRRRYSMFGYFRSRWAGRSGARLAGSACYLCHSLVYSAVAIYAPAAALAEHWGGGAGAGPAQLAPLVLLIAAVCVAYTALGGIRAVVWTDTVQAAFMLLGLVLLIAKATYRAGGLAPVLRSARAFHADQPLWNTDPRPFQYSNVWMVCASGIVFRLSFYAFHQPSVQRFTAVSSLGKGRLVLAVAALATAVNQSLCAFVGLLMLHHYRAGGGGRAGGRDGVPLVLAFVQETLDSPYDLPGLFLGGVMSGTLSTVSTCLHSSATVLWEEIFVQLMDGAEERRFREDLERQERRRRGLPVTPHVPGPWDRALRSFQAHALWYGRLLVVLLGAAGAGLALAVGHSGGVIAAGTGAMGIFGGLVVGLFTLGLFFGGRVVHAGAVAGVAVGAVLSLSFLVLTASHGPYAAHRLSLNASQGLSPLPDGHFGDPAAPTAARLPKFLLNILALVTVVAVGLVASELHRLWDREGAAAQDASVREQERLFRAKDRASAGVHAFQPTTATQPLIRLPSLPLFNRRQDRVQPVSLPD